ncbi:MAG: Crp/Fnr family transcriptional regulator [Bacteroidetes bacterium B1(2017)]|nr:MAG: Crp/Fnr family transcriptional regulator [Bacteroidetes bacterium B1(2017)]
MFNDPKLEASFLESSSIMKLPEGGLVMNPGEIIRFIPIVKSGCLRVLRQNSDENEVFLYHIMPGETCAMSITCCTAGSVSEIHALAEEATELHVIPIEKMEEWQQYKEWRDFIASTYKTRFERMLKTIDDLAFEKLDERLWKYLLARANAKENNSLQINHEEIARELNIQRESATRLIKKLKELGYLETTRGHITLLKNELSFEL